MIVKLLSGSSCKFRNKCPFEAAQRQYHVHQQVGHAHVGRFPDLIGESEVKNYDKRGESDSTCQNE